MGDTEYEGMNSREVTARIKPSPIPARTEARNWQARCELAEAECERLREQLRNVCDYVNHPEGEVAVRISDLAAVTTRAESAERSLGEAREAARAYLLQTTDQVRHDETTARSPERREAAEDQLREVLFRLGQET